jgi:ribosomal protein S18 acetylase RimI-like enzyme
MSVDIGPADRDELDALADLWVDLAVEQREHGSHLHASANRAAIRESLARHLVVDGLIVAREDGPVGFVAFDHESSGYERTVDRGVVRNLYVVPGRRDEGIGSRLLEAAETALAEAGVDRVALEALASNEAGRRFYERHGYRDHRVELEKRVETDTKERG